MRSKSDNVPKSTIELSQPSAANKMNVSEVDSAVAQSQLGKQLPSMEIDCTHVCDNTRSDVKCDDTATVIELDMLDTTDSHQQSDNHPVSNESVHQSSVNKDSSMKAEMTPSNSKQRAGTDQKEADDVRDQEVPDLDQTVTALRPKQQASISEPQPGTSKELGSYNPLLGTRDAERSDSQSSTGVDIEPQPSTSRDGDVNESTIKCESQAKSSKGRSLPDPQPSTSSDTSNPQPVSRKRHSSEQKHGAAETKRSDSAGHRSREKSSPVDLVVKNIESLFSLVDKMLLF